MVPGRAVVRALLCDLPPPGECASAGQALDAGPPLRLDVLLRMDLPARAGLEQLHCQQDRNHLRAELVSRGTQWEALILGVSGKLSNFPSFACDHKVGHLGLKGNLEKKTVLFNFKVVMNQSCDLFVERNLGFTHRATWIHGANTHTHTCTLKHTHSQMHPSTNNAIDRDTFFFLSV